MSDDSIAPRSRFFPRQSAVARPHLIPRMANIIVTHCYSLPHIDYIAVIAALLQDRQLPLSTGETLRRIVTSEVNFKDILRLTHQFTQSFCYLHGITTLSECWKTIQVSLHVLIHHICQITNYSLPSINSPAYTMSYQNFSLRERVDPVLDVLCHVIQSSLDVLFSLILLIGV